ncbi:MAG: pentapeptide repeat-containing protein [Cyanobacteria bacterium P01_D01_bin.156]
MPEQNANPPRRSSEQGKIRTFPNKLQPPPPPLRLPESEQKLTLHIPEAVTVKQPDPTRWEIWKQVFWSLVSVIGVPLALLLVSHEIEQANEATAQNTREAESIDAYVDSVGELLLNIDIEQADPSKIERLIRSKTLLVTRQINPNRKGQVVRFLYDQELIFSEQEVQRRQQEITNAQSLQQTTERLEEVPPQELAESQSPQKTTEEIEDTFHQVNLGGLDLVGVNLNSAFIPGINLANTTMQKANLSNTNLVRADFTGADLNRADLSGADLSSATLDGSNLANAVFTDDTTSQAVCEKYSLLKEGESTCPTIFPDGFDPSTQTMVLLQ